MTEQSSLRPKKEQSTTDKAPVLVAEAANATPTSMNLFTPATGLTLSHTLSGHTRLVTSVRWSPDGKTLASSSNDKTVRLWDATNGTLLRTLSGHTERVKSVVWSPTGLWLASSADDKTVWVWDATNGTLLRTLSGHRGGVRSVAWSPDGKTLATGSVDRTLKLWNATDGTLLRTLEGHTDAIFSVAWSPDGERLATGSFDKTVRLWDATNGTLLRILSGHTNTIFSVAWSPDGKRLATGSFDKTVHLWDTASGKLVRILEDPTNMVWSVTWSPSGHILVSVSCSGNSSFNATVSIWRTDIWEPLAVLTGLKGFTDSSWHPVLPLLATVSQQRSKIGLWQLDLEHLSEVAPSPTTVHYTNAKVVLLGESGVGKSGLGLVLSRQPFTATESSHGRHVWRMDQQEVPLDEHHRETREILLWDLAGQPGYRLIHQLHLGEVAVALVVFDASSDTDPFTGVQYWDRALRLAQRIGGGSALPLKKWLVAARIDRGGIGVSPERIQTVVRELGFDGYVATSAREGWQIDELRKAICEAIDWRMLPKVTSTVQFRQIKQFLFDEKQGTRRLISSIGDLYRTFLLTKDAPVETPKLPTQFETCIGRVESMGLIKRLSFGNLVLLRPELLDAYASALFNAVKDESDGLGSIAEEQVRAGGFRVPTDECIQEKEQEKLLLVAMIEDLLRYELALREEGTLIFPSQATKEHPDLPDPQGKTVIFGFEGPVLHIYATLAVRLARSGLFKKQDLWKNAVTYTTLLRSGTCGMYLSNIAEGRADLTLFFDGVTSSETRHAFTEYVSQYLFRRALPDTLKIRHIVVCNTCRTVIPENIVQLRKKRNFDWLSCPVCEARVSLIERVCQFPASPSPRVNEMDLVADTQREREAAQSTLQGKIATGDFDVFLCHHGGNKLIVRQIGEQLKEQGILPWLDEWELRPGLPWQQALERQIEHIKTAAVFVGTDGIGPWQHQELDAFLREFVRRKCPVIPVLLPDAPHEPVLPVFLRAMTWVDFRVQDPDPLQRLLWGITGKRDLEESIP